jgi:hypothetical protein
LKRNVLFVGLTGAVGAGKSEVARFLDRCGGSSDIGIGTDQTPIGPTVWEGFIGFWGVRGPQSFGGKSLREGRGIPLVGAVAPSIHSTRSFGLEIRAFETTPSPSFGRGGSASFA